MLSRIPSGAALSQIVAGSVVFILLIPTAAAQTTFTVNSAGSSGDQNSINNEAQDGVCDTGFSTCTLRAAIQEANANSETDSIHFDISGSPPYTIQQPSNEPLPSITEPVVIDGTTEPDYDGSPVIELNGENLDFENGIKVSAGKLNVKALSIYNYDIGLNLDNDSGGNVVKGCYIGVEADGTTGTGNNTGISVPSSLSTEYSATVIGGPKDSKGNLISGNTGRGVSISAESTIQGNKIGVDVNGDPLGNRFSGIAVFADSVIVGGSEPGEGNTLRNNRDGINITGNYSTIEGNQIYENKELGVTISGEGNSVRKNQIYKNGGLGIDLGLSSGRTENDAGDGDDGGNRLQNFPEIDSAGYDADLNELTVVYSVDSTPNLSGAGTSTYPLTIDIYRADTDGEEGAVHLGSDTYSKIDFGGCGAPPCPDTLVLNPQSTISTTDSITATATDDKGNTSEFSGSSSQLPVELASLTGVQVGGNSLRLSWKTSSETNNAGFEVQRQKETEEWVRVGYVDSKVEGGSTTETQSYSFVTSALPVGSHKFRLKQVDLDGSSTLTDPISVDIQMQESVKLKAPAPNPVSASATISFAVEKRVKTTIAVYNTLGQRVATAYERIPQAGELQSFQFDTSDLSSGTYFLRLKAGGRTQTRKLTVVQ